MPRTFLRIAAVLLSPCLVGDPIPAAVHHPLSPTEETWSLRPRVEGRIFAAQALAEDVQMARLPEHKRRSVGFRAIIEPTDQVSPKPSAPTVLDAIPDRRMRLFRRQLRSAGVDTKLLRGAKAEDAQPLLVRWMEEQHRHGRLDERTMKELAYVLGTITDSVTQRLPELIGLFEMDIGDGGATLTSASHFAAGVLARVGELRMEEAPALPDLNQDPLIKRSSLAELFPGARTVHFERRMGRTLIFNVDGRKIALKLLKKGERRRALGREAILNSWIGRNKRRLRLWSRYPKPLGQTAQGAPVLYDFALEGLPEAAQDAIKGLRNTVDALGRRTMEVNVEEGWVEALVYEADDDYFTYLSAPDLSPKRFSTGLRKAMHDLFILARLGLFHRALIDAFHAADGPSGRRFFWMVDLLIRSVGGGFGTGRLRAFLEAVRYANIRVSGLADMGDIATIDEIVAELRRFPLMKHLSAAKVKAHAMLNMLGEYWLAAVLLHGPRLHQQTGEFGDPEALAKSFERDVLKTSLAAFTQWPAQVVRKALENANLARLGLQMNLFLTKRYVPFLRPRPRPTAIEHSQVFPEHAKVRILSYGLGQWDENVGFISRLTGSQPALGPVCGPFLISEIIDISYRILAPLIFMMSTAAKPSAEPAQRHSPAGRAA